MKIVYDSFSSVFLCVNLFLVIQTDLYIIGQLDTNSQKNKKQTNKNMAKHRHTKGAYIENTQQNHINNNNHNKNVFYIIS